MMIIMNVVLIIFYTCVFNGCNKRAISYNVFNIIQNTYNICEEKYQTNNAQRTLPIITKTTTTCKNSTIQTTTTILISNLSTTIGVANKAIQHLPILSMLINSLLVTVSVRFLFIHW